MRHIVPKSICIDFDGTLCMKEDPKIGKEVPGAFDVLKRLKAAGHTLILFTNRTDELVDEAVAWCKERGVEFDYININGNFDNGSRKVYAHLYIDDHGLGIPLAYDPQQSPKEFVDWYRVKDLLMIKKYL